jgi:hypothetical protein
MLNNNILKRLKEKVTITAVMNVAALEKKEEYETIMKSGEFSECLREELTHLIFINNLRLITTKN